MLPTCKREVLVSSSPLYTNHLLTLTPERALENVNATLKDGQQIENRAEVSDTLRTRSTFLRGKLRLSIKEAGGRSRAMAKCVEICFLPITVKLETIDRCISDAKGTPAPIFFLNNYINISNGELDQL